VSEKLAKMVLMLSSSSDGEVVSAARAIGRLLVEQGRDWHDLADVVRAMETPSPSISGFSMGGTARPAYPGARQADTPPNGYMSREVYDKFEALVLHVHRMTSIEKRFMGQIAMRIARYGYERTFVTSKQVKWILDLHARYAGGRR
jgi:hypothetical protein